MRIKNTIRTLVLASLAAMPFLSHAEIIEVVTFKLNPGVSYEEFAPLDKAVQTEYISKRSGFLSREAAKGTDGEWLVIVHWKTEQDADASMNSFMTAPAASEFVSHLQADTMSMKRYTK